MDPIFKFPASPGTPLFPVSPERANRQQLPHSPSMSSVSHIQNDSFSSHSRQSSDVQGKVAQFNNLTKEAAQRRKDNEAALKRAVLGREEAESETRRLKEENTVLRRDVEEGRGRERRVGERLESVMVRSTHDQTGIMANSCNRRIYNAQKKHMHIRRPSTKRKSVGRGKKRLNPRVRW